MKYPVEELREAYLKLIDEEHVESVYQTFIEQNTRLVPREFVQNHSISNKIVLRKPSLGADYKSDFAFLSKSSSNWNAVHIEIEKPWMKYFKGSSQKLSTPFQNAIDQINDWRAWFQSTANAEAFRNIVRPLLNPEGMTNNPINHKFVLVYGRRAEYIGNPQRVNKMASLKTHDFTVMSFDSLAESLDSKPELSLGIRKNDGIELYRDEVLDPFMYGSMEPTLFSISEKLRDLMINDPRENYRRIVDGKDLNALHYFGQNARVRSEESTVVEQADDEEDA
ncbi:Shedu anti-phage system protein SduA domain-containing protein [Neorhizobium tomejilense]|uniref:Shedu anti-phage system protein SduA domain-containing protein n=1 Tax=Neorhizobium tomejilense TaxID=2093828 RepID=UPI003ECF3CFE